MVAHFLRPLKICVIWSLFEITAALGSLWQIFFGRTDFSALFQAVHKGRKEFFLFPYIPGKFEIWSISYLNLDNFRLLNRIEKSALISIFHFPSHFENGLSMTKKVKKFSEWSEQIIFRSCPISEDFSKLL